MNAYPIDSHVEYDENNIPIYDRAITSAILRKFIRMLFSDGIMPNPSTNLQVAAGTGMNVIVKPGFGICNGCMKLEEEQVTLAVQAADASYGRIDTVVLRLDINDAVRSCELAVLTGTPSANPVRPNLTRNGSVWEIGLADIKIPANATSIKNANITDTRYETARCGVISSISEFDTTKIYQQVIADLAQFKMEEQEEFLAWFDRIKNQLSKTADGNLQLQLIAIDDIYDSVSVYMADVDADTYYPTSDASILVGSPLTNIDVVAQNGYYTHLQAVKKGDLLVLANDYNFGATSDNQNLIVLNDERTVIDLVPFLELNDTRAYRIKEDGFIFISCKYIEWALDIHLFDVKTPKNSSNGDYTLTEADKQEIAQMVLDSLPAAEEATF